MDHASHVDVGQRGRDLRADSKGCPSDCSGHGNCMKGVCSCDAGFAGKDCSVEFCRNNCNEILSETCDHAIKELAAARKLPDIKMPVPAL